MNRLTKSLLFLSFLLLGRSYVYAQLIGSELYLQGKYVEVGIAQNGAFGTSHDAPSGYHPRGVGLWLGFVADPDKDGWGVGTPNYIGDYFLPGSPQEGWDMEVDGIWAQAWRGAGSTSFTGGLTGTCTAWDTTGGIIKGTWEGTLGKLNITAITRIKKDKLYFTTTVKIKNTGTATLYNFYYDRTVDPDNEVAVPGGGSFTTDNKIVYALPSPNNKSLVTAIGTSSIKAYLGLASRDCRARPYIITSSLSPTDSLHEMYSGNGISGTILKVDSLYTNDVGIGIVFKIDSLRGNDSTQLSYAYVLSAADVDSAFEDLKPQLSIGGKIFASGDTIKACVGSKVNIDIVGGDYYQWKWSPTTGLSDSVGSRITITAPGVKTTYTASASSTLCPIDPVKIVIDPIANPDKPKVVTPLYYCQYDAAAPLTATLTGISTELRFYNSATGGTALTTLTPVTITAGSKNYYVSQVTAGLCESEREMITVITRAIPVISSFKSTDPTYCGAQDGTITFKSDSAFATYTLTYDKNGKPVSSTTITTDDTGGYTITGLGGGSYTGFVVINKYGCKSSPFFGPVDLKNPAPPGPAITNNGPLCVDREARLTAPFIAGATYSWTGPDGFTSTDRLPSFTTTPNSGGTYTLVVSVGECIYQPSFTTLVITPTPDKQKLQNPYRLCEGTDLIIDLVRQPNVNYEWAGNGVVQTNSPLTLKNIATDKTGTYFLTASSENGCVTMDTAQVYVDTRLSFAIVSDTAICTVDSAWLQVTTNGTSVTWDPVAGLSSATGTMVMARPSVNTVYTATVHSDNTCPDRSGSVNVQLIPTPQVTGYDTLVRMNIPYTLLPTYGQDVVKYRWEPADSLSCANCPNPVFNSSKDMTYIIYASNTQGCTGHDTMIVRVFCDGANITMPNAFTPNNDGNNDIFYVRGTGFTVKSFAIYNRLGQEVFRKENFNANDPKFGWDGTFNGQSISDASGFVYMLEAVCLHSNNEPILIKGTVLMIK
ncbi:MAG: gliding motility-associated C-terminal domain-containing protein [Chitinophagaceae bacterium]